MCTIDKSLKPQWDAFKEAVERGDAVSIPGVESRVECARAVCHICHGLPLQLCVVVSAHGGDVLAFPDRAVHLSRERGVVEMG